jgi:lipoate-protein ligase A
MTSVQIERFGGSAGQLLEQPIPDPLPNIVVQVFEPSRTALILGSGQKDDIVNWASAQSADTEVARRRSGGGAVLLVARGSSWIDVLVPRVDPRWSDDVVASARWLGEAWAGALWKLGVPAAVHPGGLERTRWGPLVCFGALGPGEVVVAGRKVVGISQRRTRLGSRFECLVLNSWDPASLLDLLVMERNDRAEALADLTDVAAGPGVPIPDLEHAFLAELQGP